MVYDCSYLMGCFWALWGCGRMLITGCRVQSPLWVTAPSWDESKICTGRKPVDTAEYNVYLCNRQLENKNYTWVCRKTVPVPVFRCWTWDSLQFFTGDLSESFTCTNFPPFNLSQRSYNLYLSSKTSYVSDVTRGWCYLGTGAIGGGKGHTEEAVMINKWEGETENLTLSVTHRNFMFVQKHWVTSLARASLFNPTTHKEAAKSWIKLPERCDIVNSFDLLWVVRCLV